MKTSTKIIAVAGGAALLIAALSSRKKSKAPDETPVQEVSPEVSQTIGQASFLSRLSGVSPIDPAELERTRAALIALSTQGQSAEVLAAMNRGTRSLQGILTQLGQRIAGTLGRIF